MTTVNEENSISTEWEKYELMVFEMEKETMKSERKL